MYSYKIEEWIIFFMIYSFIGWIYEEIFFLVKEKKLVNRGFMHGPFLPIYGVGALIILLAVMPISQNPLLVFIIGGAAATLLELLTGMAMEALFHVRYWDYTGYFLNYKGHICLFATTVWCVASVLMVNFVQIPLANFLQTLNTTAVYAIAHMFSLGFAADFALSFREALDFRRILDTLTAENEELAHIVAELETKKAEFEAGKARLEAEFDEMKYKAAIEIERRKFNAESDMEQLKMLAEAGAERIMQHTEEAAAHLKQQQTEFSDRIKQQQTEFSDRIKQQKAELSEQFKQQREQLKASTEQLKEIAEQNAENIRRDAETELERIKYRLRTRKQRLELRIANFKHTSGYDRIRLIMLRNNIVSSERYKKALEQLEEMANKHNSENKNSADQND